MLIALGDLKVEPLVLTAEELGREPRRSNANLVWAYSGVTVPSGCAYASRRSCSMRSR